MAKLIEIWNDFAEDFLLEFAGMTIWFGRLEYLLRLIVKDYLGQGFTDGFAHAESKRQFATLCDEAMTLFDRKYLGPKDRAVFKTLMARAKEIGDQRNDMVHALWTTDGMTNPKRYRPKWDKSTKRVSWARSRVVTAAEVEMLKMKVATLFHDLDDDRKGRGFGAPKLNNVFVTGELI